MPFSSFSSFDDAYSTLPISLLKEINGVISKSYGMSFDEFSLVPLKEKVLLRMKDLDIKDPMDYLSLILHGKKELTNLMDSLTINVTSFFRVPKHFQFFGKTFLQETEKRNAKTKRLRIWSAGCSNGAEPYSIAMELFNYFGKKISLWDIKILASDINFHCLLEGQNGEYKKKLLQEIPEDYQKLYCEDSYAHNDMFQIKPEVKKLITWDYHNLLYDNGYRGFDIIFCRNVLYYFPETSQQQVLSLFYDKLREEGILIMGSSEYSAVNYQRDFQSQRFQDFYFYQKPSREV